MTRAFGYSMSVGPARSWSALSWPKGRTVNGRPSRDITTQFRHCLEIMNISVIIPAYNEEAYLPATLASIAEAAAILTVSSGVRVEILVVDNNSTDTTTAVAQAAGATVVREPEQGIARARNTGARHASEDVLVFVDADVSVPPGTLSAIHAAVSDPSCVGGGVDVEYRPRRALIRFYLRCWRLLAQRLGMVQGATQFCRRSTFEAIGGYDERAWIGEDVDFYWAMRWLARSTGGSVRLIRSPRVQASSRRFDNWPVWKTLLWTNPLVIALFRRRKWTWGGWYSRPVR